MDVSDFKKIKLEAVNKLKELHLKLSELILYNNLPKKQWDKLVLKIEDVRLSRIRFITEFLLELENTIWKDMYSVWTQPNMTTEMWYNYKILFDRPTLIEQKQMKSLEKSLKERWKRWQEQYRDRLVAEKEGKVQDSEHDVKVTIEELIDESKAITQS